MKKYLSQLFLSIFLFVAFCCFFNPSFAIGDPGDDPDVPIDGGLSILIAAGVGYGVKKIRDERKKRTTNLQ